MKKTTALFSTLLCALALLYQGCTGLNDLSTDAMVESFELTQVYNESVELGTPRILAAEHEIVIPLNYGKYIQNIQFGSKIKINSSAKRLLNINPDTITFQNYLSEVAFYVASESGYSNRWVIRLEDNDQHNSSADILHMDVLSHEPEKCLVADTAFIYIDGNNKYVKILAPEATFPLTIHPSFLLSDSAHLVGRKTTDALTFSSSRVDLQQLTVQAENGAESLWQAYVEQGEAVYAVNNDNYLPEQLHTVNIDAASLAANLMGGSTQNELMGIDVDSVNNTITLLMRNLSTSSGEAIFPIRANLDFNDRFNQVLIGYHKGSELLFSKKSDTHKFYLFDRYNDLKKAWTVKVGHYLSNEANVEKFLITKTSPSSIIFDSKSTDINTEAGIVTLVVTDGNTDFPANIRANIEVSRGAKLSGLSSGTDFQMASMSAVKKFTITAEDGTVRQWELHLQFAGVAATGADVESFRLTEWQGQNGLMVLNPVGTIDKQNHTVTLHITDKGSDFPLRLRANMTTSYKSVFTSGQFSSSDYLTFNTKTDRYQFTLRSQDGLTTNTYTILLSDESPAAQTGAELLTFSPTMVASGYTLANTIVNKATREITLVLTGKGSGAFSFRPKYTLSAGATAQGLSNNQDLTFASLTDVKTFTITSEDGATVNNWTIAVSYQPQLPNWQLNSWGTNSSTNKPEPTSWSTCNVQLSSVAAQVTKGTGQDGSNCAKCVGQSVLGHYAAGSIFFGEFKMDISKLSNPKLMTNFHLAFDGKPKSMTADINYTSGDGKDKMSIDIHLYHYSGSGTPTYHTMWSWGTGTGGAKIAVADPTYEPNVTIVGFAREELGSTNGWVTHTTPITYTGYPNMAPNYLHIAYCCSYRGDYDEGSTASVLYVDNVRLDY